MTLRPLILALLLGLGLAPTAASATGGETAELRRQIEALTQRVEILERRLGEVSETQSAIVAETPLPSGDPWQQLDIGMTFGKVEALLGKPLSRQKGSVEMWYYSDARKAGPFVKFIFKQVHSWRGPAPDTPQPGD